MAWMPPTFARMELVRIQQIDDAIQSITEVGLANLWRDKASGLEQMVSEC